jgi:magnesium transporter
MQLIKGPSLTWINLARPNRQDVRFLTRELNIHPALAEQLAVPTLRPMVEHFDVSLYVVLHFPIFNEEKKTSESAEIDFLLTPSLLLTAHYQEIEPLSLLLKKCSFAPGKNKITFLDKGAVFLFYYIVKELFKFSLREIDHIHEKISEIEEGIFEGREKEMVGKISLVRRDIINFMSALKPQRMVLENLLAKDYFLDGYTKPYITDLMYEYDKSLNLITTKKETIEALHDTNESLLNDKTNDIMKTLTIMAFVTFPLSLLAAIFSLETATTPPLIGLPYDFWIIIGIMTAAMTSFFAFFKYKKWL